ncbi:hypothetical protein JTE90_024582 [Oedothorax gibbosus]|uniref:Uncharacterized protein n=1 Tax=Oedothorax gibbosus TaxID=931172 RepID=A0AAV6VF49_9ARAC|nr:hypothetical protein JTE90_024582 [Oedothorax gibbosus]
MHLRKSSKSTSPLPASKSSNGSTLIQRGSDPRPFPQVNPCALLCQVAQMAMAETGGQRGYTTRPTRCMLLMWNCTFTKKRVWRPLP